jgi:hypothetical protein
MQYKYGFIYAFGNDIFNWRPFLSEFPITPCTIPCCDRLRILCWSASQGTGLGELYTLRRLPLPDTTAAYEVLFWPEEWRGGLAISLSLYSAVFQYPRRESLLAGKHRKRSISW